jgi:hypothetical protein
MSGEERVCADLLFYGSEPAHEDGLPANQSFPDVLTNKTQPKKSHLFGGSPAS